MGEWREQAWLIEKGEHFTNTITRNVRSVTWQGAGSTWCQRLIVLFDGMLDQRAGANPSHALALQAPRPLTQGLDYRMDQLGGSSPQGSRVI